MLSKIIVDRVDGVWRLGGGGVQAAVGSRLACAAANCALFAPVGADFDRAMLGALAEGALPMSHAWLLNGRLNDHCHLAGHGVDVEEVRQLPHVERTPAELISYGAHGEMLFENVGWEGWDELCSWVPAPRVGGFDAWHIIAEGGGRGEADAVLSLAPEELPGMVSVEPVMHSVDASAVTQLARLTCLAAVVSPDLRTALRIAQLAAAGDGLSTDERPTDDAALLQTLAGCAKMLQISEDALLAVRDGALAPSRSRRPPAQPTARRRVERRRACRLLPAS